MPNALLMKPSPGMTKRQKGHRLSKGLVAHWVMNDRSAVGGTIRDYSGHNNTGTMVADTHFITGRIGPALDFDGAGDHFDTGITDLSSANSGEIIVIATWINPNALGGTGTTNADVLAGKTGTIEEWVWEFEGSDGLYFRTFGGNNGGTSDVWVIDEWQHAVVVWNVGTNIVTYRNGEQIDDTVVTDTSALGPDDIRFGYKEDGASNFFDGQIDNIQIYNRALTSGEVHQLFLDSLQMVRDPLFLTFKQAAAAGGNLPHTVNETWGW